MLLKVTLKSIFRKKKFIYFFYNYKGYKIYLDLKKKLAESIFLWNWRKNCDQKQIFYFWRFFLLWKRKCSISREKKIISFEREFVMGVKPWSKSLTYQIVRPLHTLIQQSWNTNDEREKIQAVALRAQQPCGALCALWGLWRQGRSKKWPKEGVLRPEIAKGGGFEGAEALQKCARMSFC